MFFLTPFLKISIFTFLPTFVFPTIGGKDDDVSIFLLSNFKIISPTFKSDFDAGPSGIILDINAQIKIF